MHQDLPLTQAESERLQRALIGLKDQRLPGLFCEPADADLNGPIWIDIRRDEECGVGMRAAHRDLVDRTPGG